MCVTGFYLMVNMSGSVDGETAVVSVPLPFQTTDLCVGFWYYMLGPSVSNLDLLVQTVCTVDSYYSMGCFPRHRLNRVLD